MGDFDPVKLLRRPNGSWVYTNRAAINKFGLRRIREVARKAEERIASKAAPLGEEVKSAS